MTLENDYLRLPAPCDEGSEEAKLQLQLERLCDAWARFSRRYQDLKAELAQFHDRYNGVLGRLFVQLEQLDLQVRRFDAAVEILKKVPDITDGELVHWVNVRFREQKQRLACLRKEIADSRRRRETERADPPLNPDDRKLLRRLYRRLVKEFHPDLQRNEEEQRECEILMARINELYTAGDLEGLEMIAAESREVLRHVFSCRQEYIEWLRSRVARVEARLVEMQKQLDELANSDLAVLRTRVSDARRQNRDLLQEMRADLKKKVDAKRRDVDERGTQISQSEAELRGRLCSVLGSE